MKKTFVVFLFFWMTITSSQNKQVLYGFNELPQTLLLNPAAKVNYKFHVGVPLMSGFSAAFGSSKFVLSDLFATDNLVINDKVSNLLASLSSRDFLQLNTQVEVINAGFRYDEKNYISFGFYQEIDAIGYIPKDLLIFFTEGNSPNLNKNFSASHMNYKADLLGVFHLGASREIDEKLTLGARFKIYSSALNLQSKNNTGTFTTVDGSNNLYTHYLSNINLNFQTSGLVANNEYIQDASTYIGNTLLGGNLGLGLDFGVNYNISSQLEFSASILDLGFINHKKNIKNTTVKGDFLFEGVEFGYNANSSINYWEQIDERLKSDLPTENNQESYISWRPTKLNAALKYSFGERRSKVCYDNTLKDFYTDAIGVQLFNVFRPLYPQVALTAFYQKSISDNFNTKVTYTVDTFSYSNIGIGFSAKVWKMNFYGIVDNILGLENLASTNNLSLQLGLNLIFN